MVVVYHSRYGNTERIARAIAEGLSQRGSARVLPIDDVLVGGLDLGELVVIGGPTQVHGVSPAVAAFLKAGPRTAWRGRPVAAFDTRYRIPRWQSGSAARGIARRLRRMGGRLVAPPESFFVAGGNGPLEKGEEDRAAAWGRSLPLPEFAR